MKIFLYLLFVFAFISHAKGDGMGYFLAINKNLNPDLLTSVKSYYEALENKDYETVNKYIYRPQHEDDKTWFYDRSKATYLKPFSIFPLEVSHVTVSNKPQALVIFGVYTDTSNITIHGDGIFRNNSFADYWFKVGNQWKVIFKPFISYSESSGTYEINTEELSDSFVSSSLMQLTLEKDLNKLKQMRDDVSTISQKNSEETMSELKENLQK